MPTKVATIKKRASRASTRRRRSASGDVGRKAFIDALNFLFTFAAAKESMQSHVATAEEFLAEAELLFSKKSATRTVGGSSTRMQRISPLRRLMAKILGVSIGTFDTPCNTIMAFISIALYAIMFYTLGQAFVEECSGPQRSTGEILSAALANPTYTDAIHTPTRWFFRNFIPSLENAANTYIGIAQNEVNRHLNRSRDFVSEPVCRPTVIGTLTYMFLQWFFTSRTYTIGIQYPIACTLYNRGVVSCRELCGILTLMRA